MILYELLLYFHYFIYFRFNWLLNRIALLLNCIFLRWYTYFYALNFLSCFNGIFYHIKLHASQTFGENIITLSYLHVLQYFCAFSFMISTPLGMYSLLCLKNILCDITFLPYLMSYYYMFLIKHVLLFKVNHHITLFLNVIYLRCALREVDCFKYS